MGHFKNMFYLSLVFFSLSVRLIESDELRNKNNTEIIMIEFKLGKCFMVKLYYEKEMAHQLQIPHPIYLTSAWLRYQRKLDQFNENFLSNHCIPDMCIVFFLFNVRKKL